MYKGFNDRIARAPENEGGAAAPAVSSLDSSAGEQGTQASMADLGKVLNYDFTLGNDSASPNAPDAGGSAAPAAAPASDAGKANNGAPADGGKTAQPADANPAPAEVDPIEALKKLAPQAAPKASNSEELMARALDLLTKQAEGNQPAAGGKPKADAVPDAEAINYQMNIPKEILGAVGSEDPEERAQGIQALSTGLAVTIHRAMRKEFTEKFAELVQTLPQIMKQHTDGAAERQATYNDFYTSYPQLKDPKLQPYVLEAARKVATTTGVTTYSPEFKLALKAQFDKDIAEMLKAAQTAAGVPNGGTPPAQVPVVQNVPAGTAFMGGNNSRPSAPANNDIGAEIALMMNGF